MIAEINSYNRPNNDPKIKNKERKIAHSQEYRRKDNGNFISSIYPPGQAIYIQQNINENIEKELTEFMEENEEKFKNSKMNQNYKFPLKTLKFKELNFRGVKILRGNTPISSSHRNSRRYKSQENRHKFLNK